jgi:hypothetical protein
VYNIVGNHFPSTPLMPGAEATVCAVCVRSPGPQPLAVYLALVPELCSGRTLKGDQLANLRAIAMEWTAAHGVKLRYREAVAHFPSIRESDYRA